MNPRTTGILFGIALALAAFLYFYEYRGGEGWRESEQPAEALFPEVEASAIDSIELTTSAGTRARVTRVPDGWQVVEPVTFPGDEVALDGMASALADLRSESVIEEPQPPEVYALGDAAQRVRFTVDGAEHELRVGKKTPVGANTYVATGAGARIFTVPTFRVNAFQRSLDDLRERRPLRFDRTTIRRIEASWPEARVVLAQSEGAWRLLEPLEAPADESTVETLLSDLSFLRASGFLDDPPPDAELGLAAPAFRVVLEGEAPEAGGEPARFVMAVGAPLEDGTRPVRAAEAALYRIPEERFEDLPRRVTAYRFKELARFLASDARRLELVFHDASAGVVRVAAERGDEGWRAEPEPVAEEKLASLVAELARLRAQDIAAESMGAEELAALGLDPPRVLFRVWGEVGEGGEPPRLAEVQLGRLDARGVFARVPEREIVYLLAASVGETLPVDLEAFRNRFVVSDAEGEADGEEAAEAGEFPTPELDEE